MLRLLPPPLGFALLLVSACADRARISDRCDEDHACSDGLYCVNERCVETAARDAGGSRTDAGEDPVDAGHEADDAGVDADGGGLDASGEPDAGGGPTDGGASDGGLPPQDAGLAVDGGGDSGRSDGGNDGGYDGGNNVGRDAGHDGGPSAPVATDSTAIVARGHTITLTLDVSGPGPLGWNLVSGPGLGSLGSFDPTTATVNYTANSVSDGVDTFTFEVTGPGGTSATATVTIDVITATSCLGYLEAGVPRANGVYWLDRLVSGSGDYEAYCDMNTDGGGWTLVLKSDPNDARLAFGSGDWENSNTFDTGDPGLDHQRAKLRSFSEVPVTEVLVGLSPDDDFNAPYRFVQGSVPRADSLLEVMLRPANVVQLGVDKADWLGLLDGAALQENCNAEGYVEPNAGRPAARFGIVANNETDCQSMDSALGVGLIPNESDGLASGNAGDSFGPSGPPGSVTIAAWGAVLVRGETDHRALPSATSCAAHLAAGRTVSGYYTVTAGGTPTDALCDMSSLGGGWSLVARSHPSAGFNEPFAWSVAAGAVDDFTGAYSFGPGWPALRTDEGLSAGIDNTGGYVWVGHYTNLPPLQSPAHDYALAGPGDANHIRTSCGPGSPFGTRWGYLAKTDHYRIDANDTTDEGLYARGWNFQVGSCTEDEVDGLQGDLWVR